MSRPKKVFIQIITFILLCIPISYVVQTYVTTNIFQNDETIYIEEYRAKVANCELLESIPKAVVLEGKYLAIDKIDTANVEYEITADGENIEFYYYLNNEFDDGVPIYNATIILSKDYMVIEEEYSQTKDNLPSEEEYVQNNIEKEKILIPLFSIMFGFTIGLIIGLVIEFIAIIIWFIKLKYKRHKERQNYEQK